MNQNTYARGAAVGTIDMMAQTTAVPMSFFHHLA